uniref:Nudix hydrolase domain-containing protein n=1 Tax=Parastrongyloides trichosuri TaxID=131310 RepID=A0A0N4ZN33_PARTI
MNESQDNFLELKKLFQPYLVNNSKVIDLKKINGSKSASVLILLKYQDGDWHVLLTVRSMQLRRHPGEIAFPGGMVDKEDLNDPIRTALRESYEEIGLELNKIQIVGQLPWVRTRFNIIMYPVIGIIKDKFVLKLNEAEVSEYFFCPMSIFLKENIYSTFNVNNFQFHSFQHYDKNIYGITAWLLIKISMIIYNRKPDFKLMYVNNNSSVRGIIKNSFIKAQRPLFVTQKKENKNKI